MGMKVFASGINYGTLASGASTQKFKALWSGATGGSVTINGVVFAGVPAGTFLPIEGNTITTPTADMVWLDW